MPPMKEIKPFSYMKMRRIFPINLIINLFLKIINYEENFLTVDLCNKLYKIKRNGDEGTILTHIAFCLHY